MNVQSPIPNVRIMTEVPLASTDPFVRAIITDTPRIVGYPTNPATEHLLPDQAMIQAAVAKLLAQPKGLRFVCFSDWFFNSLISPDSFNVWPDMVGWQGSPALLTYQKGAYQNLQFEVRRLTKVANALKAAGIVLDGACWDWESAWNYWPLADTLIPTIVADEQVRAVWPSILTALTPGKVVLPWNTPECRNFIIEFNQWSMGLAANAMWKATSLSGLVDVMPVAHNFAWRQGGRFGSYDLNGWPDNTAVTMDISCTSNVVAYLSIGQRIRDGGWKKSPLWNALIDDINRVRSVATTGSFVVTIAADDNWDKPGTPQATESLIAHALRAGCTMFDLFNPGSAIPGAQAARELAIAKIFAKHAAYVSPKPLDLPEIPLDADAIQTGSCVTSYGSWQI